MSHRKSKRQIQQDLDHAPEVLNTPIRSDGVGESPVIRDMLSDKFVKGTDVEALDIGMQLQQIILGQSSLIGRMDDLQREINILRERANTADKDAARFEADKQKFLDDVNSRADKLRVSKSEQDQIRARAGIEFQQMVTEARAKMTTNRMALQRKYASEEQVTVTSPGILLTVREGQSYIQKKFPEEIKIGTMKWQLLPNIPTQVPASVAKRYEEILRARAEAEDRASAVRIEGLNAKSQTEVAKRWNEANQKYGGDERFPMVAE